MHRRHSTPARSARWARRRNGAAAVLALLLATSCNGSDRLRAGPGLWSGEGQTAHRTEAVLAVFEAADSNADGQLSANEITRFATARFEQADRNGDGELDAAELGLSGQPVEARTLPFDLNGNGRMSLDEQLTYIRAVISDSTDPPSTVVHWLDVDRRLVR